MRHGISGRRLSRPTGHRMSMYRNLVTDLIKHERVRTTEAKGKEMRGMAEKMITLGKRGDLHARRQALSFIRDRDTVEKVFSTLAQRYDERAGGYTRLVKLGPRLGDGAPMVQLELMP
jgi:large subunit ribosomal protein L17